MKKLKRILRITLYILLIILACAGIGLTGAAPFAETNRQVLPDEVHVEQIDEKEEDEEAEEMKIG